MTDTTAPSRGPHFVQSVARALAVMQAFSADRPTLTLSEAARKTGLDRATARRLLLTLADLGYVRSDGRAFQLTPRTLELGHAYLSSLALPELARPHLQALTHALAETTALTVLDGDDVVYLALAPSFRAADIKINIGSRRTAWTTSPGRVLLAGLPDDELEKRLSEHLDLGDELKQIRVRGWALVDDDEGLRAVAVPVRNRRGTVVAAITLSTQATPDVIALEHVPEVLRTARTIEADLAAHPERAD